MGGCAREAVMEVQRFCKIYRFHLSFDLPSLGVGPCDRSVSYMTSTYIHDWQHAATGEDWLRNFGENCDVTTHESGVNTRVIKEGMKRP